MEAKSVTFVEHVMVDSSGPGIVGTAIVAFRLLLSTIVDVFGSFDWPSSTPRNVVTSSGMIIDSDASCWIGGPLLTSGVGKGDSCDITELASDSSSGVVSSVLLSPGAISS